MKANPTKNKPTLIQSQLPIQQHPKKSNTKSLNKPPPSYGIQLPTRKIPAPGHATLFIGTVNLRGSGEENRSNRKRDYTVALASSLNALSITELKMDNSPRNKIKLEGWGRNANCRVFTNLQTASTAENSAGTATFISERWLQQAIEPPHQVVLISGRLDYIIIPMHTTIHIIVTVYAKPGNEDLLEPIITGIDGIIRMATQFKCIVSITGDFNTKLEDNYGRGKLLTDLVKKFDLQELSDKKPTFYRNQPTIVQSRIDHILVHDPTKMVEFYATATLAHRPGITDHCPIVTEIHWPEEAIHLEQQVRWRQPKNEEELHKLKKLVCEAINSLGINSTPLELEGTIGRIAAKIGIQSEYRGRTKLPFLGSKRKAVLERKCKRIFNAITKLQRQGRPVNKLEAIAEEIEAAIKSEDRQTWKRVRRSLTLRANNLQSQFGYKAARTPKQYHKLKIGRNGVEEIENFYYKRFNKPESPPTNHQQYGKAILKNAKPLEQDKTITRDLTMEEIRDRLDVVANSAAGPNGIPFWLWRIIMSDDITASVVTHIANKLIHSPHQQVLEAIVVPIPKIDVPSELDHYRPITILNTLWRVVSSILAHRLKLWVADHRIINENQQGFVHNSNCETQFHNINNVKNIRASQGLATHILFIDLQNAYGSIQHESLIEVLTLMKLPLDFIKLVKSILTTHSIKIQTELGLTNAIPTNYGIPQGDSLSPLIFALYMEGVNRAYQERQSGIEVEGERINLLLFADDSTLVAATNQQLQADAIHLEGILADFGLTINSKKSIYLAHRHLNTNEQSGHQASERSEQPTIRRKTKKIITNDNKRTTIQLASGMVHARPYASYLGAEIANKVCNGRSLKRLIIKEARTTIQSIRTKYANPATTRTLLQSLGNSKIMHIAKLDNIPIIECKAMDRTISHKWKLATSSSLVAPRHTHFLPKAMGGAGLIKTRLTTDIAFINSHIRSLNHPINHTRKWARAARQLNIGSWITFNNIMRELKVTIHDWQDPTITTHLPTVSIPNNAVIYTDGSHARGSSLIGGGGIICYVDHQHHSDIALHIPNCLDNTDAEVQTITALVLMLEPNTNVQLITDYLNTVTALTKGYRPDDRHADLYNLIESTVKKNNLSIQIGHIKGHTNKVGNERADIVAEAGRTQNQDYKVHQLILDKLRLEHLWGGDQDVFHKKFLCQHNCWNPNITQLLTQFHSQETWNQLKETSNNHERIIRQTETDRSCYTYDFWRDFSPTDACLLYKVQTDNIINSDFDGNKYDCLHCGGTLSNQHLLWDCGSLQKGKAVLIDAINRLTACIQISVELVWNICQHSHTENERTIIMGVRGDIHHQQVLKWSSVIKKKSMKWRIRQIQQELIDWYRQILQNYPFHLYNNNTRPTEEINLEQEEPTNQTFNERIQQEIYNAQLPQPGDWDHDGT